MAIEASQEVGWGWIIVLCSFCSQALNGGTASMFGQLYPEVMRVFDVSEEMTMTVISMQYILLYGSGE